MAFADRSMEEKFLSQHRDNTAEYLRWACLVGAAIMIGFMWQDSMISASGYKASEIRLFGALPASALGWYLSRNRGVRRFISYISTFFWLIYACFTAAILTIYEPGPYGLTSSNGVSSFLLLLLGVFIFSNLRLWASLLVGLLTLLIYTVSIALWAKADFGNFIGGDFLAALVLVIGLAAKTLFADRVQRRLFETSERLRESYSTVEQQVRERTAELQVTNIHLTAEIAERKRADEEKKKLSEQLFQSQKMETIGHLAGGIAHDFNNILAAIMGYSNILQVKMNHTDPLYANVDHIFIASERAATLVHSLLAFSRKQTLNIKQVRINDLVSSVVKLLGRLLGEDITLETVLASKNPLVMVDAGQIDQILLNLSTNARDAMTEGGHLTITTDIAAIDDTYIKEHGYGVAGDYALITVSDTGAGMDKATQEKIFEPFFTTKEVGKGTGLGLSTAYGIVKQHSGFINCYSEPGKGTTFRIYLPLIESEKKTEDEKTGKRIELMRGGTETILVAEDDAAVRHLIVNILSQYGYTVYEAEDGEQAVQVFKEHAQEIDLLLFDVIMPHKNGKEAYRETQNIRPDVPVLFTSGYTADIIHQKGFLDEGFAVMLKPVSMTWLLQKVREVLDK